MHTPLFSRRLVYRCKVQGKNARCLFDNGANCCIMSLSWAEKNNILCKTVSNTVKTAVQEKKASQLMTLPLKLELGDFCTTWEFFILPDLSHDIFLGTDFSLRYRVTYDLFDWSMIILGDSMDISQFPAFLKKPICETESETHDEVEEPRRSSQGSPGTSGRTPGAPGQNPPGADSRGPRTPGPASDPGSGVRRSARLQGRAPAP